MKTTVAQIIWTFKSRLKNVWMSLHLDTQCSEPSNICKQMLLELFSGLTFSEPFSMIFKQLVC